MVLRLKAPHQSKFTMHSIVLQRQLVSAMFGWVLGSLPGLGIGTITASLQKFPERTDSSRHANRLWWTMLVSIQLWKRVDCSCRMLLDLKFNGADSVGCFTLFFDTEKNSWRRRRCQPDIYFILLIALQMVIAEVIEFILEYFQQFICCF